MRCVGYRQVIDYLLLKKCVQIDNKLLRINLDNNINNTKEMTAYLHNFADDTCQDMKNKALYATRQLALYATRQLAKRQCTWLKKLNKMDSSSSIKIETFGSIEEIKAKLI